MSVHAKRSLLVIECSSEVGTTKLSMFPKLEREI